MIDFTDEDIEELIDLIDFTKNSSINGIPFTCYPAIYDLVIGVKAKEEFSIDEINGYIEQVELDMEFYRSLNSNNDLFFDKVLKYLKSIAKS